MEIPYSLFNLCVCVRSGFKDIELSTPPFPVSSGQLGQPAQVYCLRRCYWEGGEMVKWSGGLLLKDLKISLLQRPRSSMQIFPISYRSPGSTYPGLLSTGVILRGIRSSAVIWRPSFERLKDLITTKAMVIHANISYELKVTWVNLRGLLVYRSDTERDTK